MSNIRLFHPENIIENTTSLLSKEHTHYVVNVMRMKRGSNINFFNKDGEWLSEIVFLDRDRVEVKFLNKLKEPTKNYNIEVILRYKSGEIFRDFELLSDQKNYNIEDRILNKYIYDYFNSYFDNEDVKKKLIKEFDGNIIMKYDNNYLDIKIIEQILNANTRNSEEKDEDHIKKNDPIFENMVVIKKDTDVKKFKKDFAKKLR